MALTSVVVVDFFICCRGDGEGKKTEARGEEEIQRVKARESKGRMEGGVRMHGEKSDKVGSENIAHNAGNTVGGPICVSPFQAHGGE